MRWIDTGWINIIRRFCIITLGHHKTHNFIDIFIILKFTSSLCNIVLNYSNRIPSFLTTFSTQRPNLVQAFSTMSLSRMGASAMMETMRGCLVVCGPRLVRHLRTP